MFCFQPLLHRLFALFYIGCVFNALANEQLNENDMH